MTGKLARIGAVPLAAAVVVLGSATMAAAYFSLTGAGSGAARAGSIAAPANFQATVDSAHQVTLSWTAPSHPAPTGYTLTQSSGTVTGTCAALAVATSCTATGLLPGTAYTWTLVASDHSWSSTPVTTSPVTTTGATSLDVDSFPAAADWSLEDGGDVAPATGVAETADADPPSVSVSGEGILVTARVTKPNGAPAGTVTFTIRGQHGESASCQGGTAKAEGSGPLFPWVTACYVTPGQLQAIDSPYTVTAVYSGDSTLAPATGTLRQTVEPAATTTTLTRGAETGRGVTPTATSPSHRRPTFTATVSVNPPGWGVPQGTVTFVATNGSKQSTTVCDAVALVNGSATCTSGTLLSSGGPYTVTATYAPTPADYLASSATWTQPDRQDTAGLAPAPSGGSTTPPASTGGTGTTPPGTSGGTGTTPPTGG